MENVTSLNTEHDERFEMSVMQLGRAVSKFIFKSQKRHNVIFATSSTPFYFVTCL